MKYDMVHHAHTFFTGSTVVPAPNRLTMFESKIYWTDSTRQGVIRVDKYDGASSIHNVYRNLEKAQDPKAIKAVHGLMQPRGVFYVISSNFLFSLGITFKHLRYRAPTT